MGEGIVFLCGGDLGGTEVDGANWPLGETRPFQTEDGRTLLYRNDEGPQAIFCGEVTGE